MQPENKHRKNVLVLVSPKEVRRDYQKNIFYSLINTYSLELMMIGCLIFMLWMSVFWDVGPFPGIIGIVGLILFGLHLSSHRWASLRRWFDNV